MMHFLINLLFPSWRFQQRQQIHSSYPDRNELIEEGSFLLLHIGRSGVIFGHMTSLWPSLVVGFRAWFGLCSRVRFREADGCPVPLQALNLLTENGLSVHRLRWAVRLQVMQIFIIMDTQHWIISFSLKMQLMSLIMLVHGKNAMPVLRFAV